MKVKAGVVVCVLAAAAGIVLAARLTGASSAGSPGDDDLVAVLREGCRQAAASVKSGRGKVIVQSWKSPKAGSIFEALSEYTVAFRGESYRFSHKTSIQRNEAPSADPGKRYLAPAGTVTLAEVAYDGQKLTSFYPGRSSATIADPVPGSPSTIRPQRAGYPDSIAIPGHAILDLQDWFAPAKPSADVQMHVLGRKMINQLECVVVEWRGTTKGTSGDRSFTAEMWIAPDAGFAVARERIWAEGSGINGKQLWRETNCEIRKYDCGMWGPARCVEEEYALTESGDTREKFRTVTTYDPDFQLNVPVSDGDLRLTLPSGTRVTDEPADASYTVP